MQINEIKAKIFDIKTEDDFNKLALEVFAYQFHHNIVYKEFLHRFKPDAKVKSVLDIPFMPITFFKSRTVLCGPNEYKVQEIFTSSGTTGNQTSKHFVTDVDLYKKSFKSAFELFYPNHQRSAIIALLPSYLERKGSSLIYMMEELIQQSGHSESGFFLELTDDKIKYLTESDEPKILFGVTFALVELAKQGVRLKNTIVFETGGMKGRGREMIREDLHDLLTHGLGVDVIHSEYGMTELLSQAYSHGKGVFECPPWMKVLLRETTDPGFVLQEGRGSINVIDLANINSCSFIATDDLGRLYPNGTFEVLGRMDHTQVRGCNLLV